MEPVVAFNSLNVAFHLIVITFKLIIIDQTNCELIIDFKLKSNLKKK